MAADPKDTGSISAMSVTFRWRQKVKGPAYCAMSMHVKDSQVVVISGAFYHGVPHILRHFGMLNTVKKESNNNNNNRAADVVSAVERSFSRCTTSALLAHVFFTDVVL